MEADALPPLERLGILATQEVSVGPDLRHMEIYTLEGLLTLLWHAPFDAEAVVVTGGGAMGGLLGPGRALYHDLGERLREHRIGTVRVGYRRPNRVAPCALDVLAAADVARRHGARRFVILGHSFGGAVAVTAAAALGEAARGVVTFATQSAECEAAADIRHVPLLLFHGERDELIPPAASQAVREIAGGGELVLLPQAGHLLTEAADEIRDRLVPWLVERLGA